MIASDQLPKLADLNRLIRQVKSYPVSVADVVKLGRQKHVKPAVIDFYQDFPADQEFADHEDLAARTEQIWIMTEEESDMPPEIILGPQE